MHNLNSAKVAALVLLREAYEDAQDVRHPVWEFAVPLDRLREAGATDSALRWLLAAGYAAHRTETTGKRARRRTFRAAPGARLTAASCCVLTGQGFALARRLRQQGRARRPADRTAPEERVPVWRADERALSFRGHVVKKFTRVAPSQELLLAAFQEEHWPRRMDNPLPPGRGTSGRQRLRDAILALNRTQAKPLLRFYADGTGEGVCWEVRS